jgi:cytochrome c-type biogenesis protein CcmH/NrfG
MGLGGNMARKEKPGNNYVKKETTLIMVFVSLGVGFLGGIVFSVFQTGPEAPSPVSVQPQQQVSQNENLLKEQTARIEALTKKTSQNPKDSGAWGQLGDLYFDTNRYKKAIWAYKKSLELNGNNAAVWTDLGVMYRRNSQPKEAIKAFDKAIETDPLHEISRFNKGIVFMHDLNDPEGAIKAWIELTQVNPLAKAPNGQLVTDLVERFKAKTNKAGKKGQ